MAYKVVDENGKVIEPAVIRMVFVCDRCGNTVRFSHGMETYRFDYTDNGDQDPRSFCSQICIQEIIRTELVNA